MAVAFPRGGRSFSRRPGRVTKAQARAMQELWPRYGIDFREAAIDLDRVFGRRAPRILDIGFGDGDALISAAANHGDIDYLVVEVHEPGIGHLLLLLERARLGNVRVIQRDIVEVAACMLPQGAFAAVNLFFPDPWPKKRHHKRRLVQPAFVASVLGLLEPGGLFHIATDWENYAEQVAGVLATVDRFEQLQAADLVHDSRAFRAPTKFEQRGRRLGHSVFDVCYRRV
jgi:tRNA (guanine-N7-)-methyltransferase